MGFWARAHGCTGFQSMGPLSAGLSDGAPVVCAGFGLVKTACVEGWEESPCSYVYVRVLGSTAGQEECDLC
jgi:hypothetical protein